MGCHMCWHWDSSAPVMGQGGNAVPVFCATKGGPSHVLCAENESSEHVFFTRIWCRDNVECWELEYRGCAIHRGKCQY